MSDTENTELTHRPLHRIAVEVVPWFPEGGGMNVSINVVSGHKVVNITNDIPEQGQYRLERYPLNQFVSAFSQLMKVAERAVIEAMKEDYDAL